MISFAYKQVLSLLLFFFALPIAMSAQELIYEIPMDAQVRASDVIIEGKVISKTSVWDIDQTNIYTINTLEIYKQFKGEPVVDLIEIITPGGTVDSKIEIVTPSLGLQIGDVGLFILHQNTVPIAGNPTLQFQPVAATQGFYKYDLKNNTVYNAFTARQGITDLFYNAILQLMNKPSYTIISDVSIEEVITSHNQSRNSNGIVEITDFSPTTLNAGVRDVLTISGTGFGVETGTIEFRDANFGGENDMGPVYFAALESQIISWTSNEIQVEVPSRAGTGDIRVTPTFGAPVVSDNILTVFFAQINLSTDSEAFLTQHFDNNNNGGYTWQMHTEFDGNAPARESFIRAFETWVCNTGINWDLGAVTPVDAIANDGINIIRFDNGDELPLGILGRTTSRFDSCESSSSPNGFDVFVNELDIVFNDEFTGSLSSVSWEFGPDLAMSAEVDFETVAVHELGHAHQLAHIINPGDIMHFSTSIAQNSRNLGASDLAGGVNVMTTNVNNPICTLGAMTFSECFSLSISESTFNESITVFPNPAQDILTITSQTVVLQKAIIYDIQGRVIKTIPFKNLDQHTIQVSELSSGIYMLQLSSDNYTTSRKLIIE